VTGSAGGTQEYVQSTGSNRAQIDVSDAAGSQQAAIGFFDQGTSKWQIGKQTDDSFFMYDNANSKSFEQVNTSGLLQLGESQSLNVNTSRFPSFFEGTWQ
jgi:hypothetical protein